MQTYHRVHVQLKKKERQQIAGMLNKGRESARVLRRALILRQLDQGQTAAQVASHNRMSAISWWLNVSLTCAMLLLSHVLSHQDSRSMANFADGDRERPRRRISSLAA